MIEIGTRVKITNVDDYGFQGRNFHPTQDHVGRVGYVLGSMNEWLGEGGKVCTDISDFHPDEQLLLITYYTVGLTGSYRMDKDVEPALGCSEIVNVVEMEIIEWDSTAETCEKLGEFGV